MSRQSRVSKEQLQSIIDGRLTVRSVAEATQLKPGTVAAYVANHRKSARVVQLAFDAQLSAAIDEHAAANKMTCRDAVRDLVKKGLER